MCEKRRVWKGMMVKRGKREDKLGKRGGETGHPDLVNELLLKIKQLKNL